MYALLKSYITGSSLTIRISSTFCIKNNS